MTRSKRNRNRQKQRQFKHQNGLCCWCLEPMILHSLSPEEWAKRADFPRLATWEHVTPQSHGGRDVRSNRVLAHRDCNHDRGTEVRQPHFQPYSTANC